MGGRGRVILALSSSAVFVAAAVLTLAGRTTPALAAAIVGVALLLLGQGLARRRPPVPVPTLGPDETAAVQQRRERDGEVAAVKQLRDAHPGLALVDAVRLVREL